MAGVYLHIPFCSQFCNYCDFYSTKLLSKKGEFVDAVVLEIQKRADELNSLGVQLSTIYVGGGTPSLLSIEETKRILETISDNFTFAQGSDDNSSIEITMEINPNDVTLEYLSSLRDIGVNRLSIGIQSFQEEHLIWMNRRHNSGQSLEAVKVARDAGFNNISIDLIFGFESLTISEWRDNIDKAIMLSPEHISCYQMGVEKGTKLYKMFTSGQYKIPHEDISYHHYEILRKTLEQAGYTQYEVSNFCKPGRESQHNSSYWKLEPYLGLGPSAHSFIGEVRSHNQNSLVGYIKAMNEGKRFAIEERRNKYSRYNEYIMISLRRVKGAEISVIESSFPKECIHYFFKRLPHLVNRGDIIQEADNIRIPPERLFVSDGIIRELFYVEV